MAQQTFERKKRIISKPEIGEFRGNGTISIPFGRENEAWTFGYMKAKAILTWYEDIKSFVAESEKKYGNK
jgi:hypothetical protein